MKIYSWNILRSNRKLPEVFDFIENLDFDVLCLQEVTDEMLVKLKAMPFHIAYHIDRVAEVIHLFSENKSEVNYVVVLSKYEILNQQQIQFPRLLRTFNSYVFEFVMEFLQKWESISNLGSVFVDIKVKEEKIRVFSVHLALWNPKTRRNEFEHLMEYVPTTGTAIVCGDFNILEYGPIKILNWLLGGSIEEGMPWYQERKSFEDCFKKYGFSNPLRGEITHKFSRSQLDHILLPNDLKPVNASVIKDSHGSDHQPICVEI